MQIVLKALIVIEHVATFPGCDAMTHHLSNNCDEVLEVFENAATPENVRAQARKVSTLPRTHLSHPSIFGTRSGTCRAFHPPL